MTLKKSVLLPFTFLIASFLFQQCGQPGARNEPFDRHGHLVYTRHARCRMDCRHINEKEIKEILEKGEINYAKSEPNGHPDPKYAFEGYTDEGQHLRVVFAPSKNDIIVITCIELGMEWECHCN
ncbi:MAG: DUF4258 domain-containing protein [Bacteroidetes bacterium]|nr:DUF4258 domain-containing protein [Bacteroidota bacterium]